jgi:hypothetical protein
MTDGSWATFEARFDEAAARIDGVRRHSTPGGVRYERGGVEFTTVAAAQVAFRLVPDIARAALRTPEATPSERGEGWIVLSPDRVDVFTCDRAVSWFESAARHAADR